MEKYIALLRGVNVGGKNKVSMPILKDSLKQVGLANVVTYINSANIIFETNLKSQLEITKLCEKVILDNFNLDIPVMIIPVHDLNIALDNAPIKIFSKTKCSKISNTTVYNKLTIRNANTTKKLIMLIG